ncbi:DUF2497 domain-containing protein [Acuticoccus sp. M5D2P5]|uniref:PopZ family protein n=1 Tax=Acuticoccus kalidii TaxID=2910977 RepID=UPI001F3CAFF3|nr:DUF2497 domain-containing protein [Acuticoccus kalidii]MCF3935088.1 DUF2497 domain-containing protein [Acuticoccus kalidii]
MEDLLASIRKIIAEENGVQQTAAPRGEPTSSIRSSRPNSPLSDADRLPELVERSIGDAFDELDAAEFDEIDEALASLPEVDDDPDSDALSSIARAIAAECEVRRARPQGRWSQSDRRPGWTPVVLSEPDIDEAPYEDDVEGHVAADDIPIDEDDATFAHAGTAQDMTAEHEAIDDDRAEAAPRNAQPAPVQSQLASLRDAFPPRTSMRPRPSPFGPRHADPEDDAEPFKADPAARDDEPAPGNATRDNKIPPFASDHRMADMSDTVMDSKPDAEGNVFRRTAKMDGDDGLTSTKTRQNVTNSFDQLSRTILSNNPRTIEDLVRDMVRPLLRDWLEANLPDIVERQVRQEIDRVTRGR